MQSKEVVTLEYVLKAAKKLSVADQLKLISLISEDISHQALERTRRHKLMDLAGVGSELWEGIEAQEYVRQERESWEN